MEAEAREILAQGVGQGSSGRSAPTTEGGRFDHLIGIWKGRGTTDEIMNELRGDG
jgi:hypothetical protein